MIKRSVVKSVMIFAWLGLFLAAAAAADDMDPASGYRIANYRSPVNLPPEGGTRVDLAGLDKLKKDGAVLIDTLPARAGYDPKTGKWRIIEQRDDIPGSTWLPNVGEGKLETWRADAWCGRRADTDAGQGGLRRPADQLRL